MITFFSLLGFLVLGLAAAGAQYGLLLSTFAWNLCALGAALMLLTLLLALRRVYRFGFRDGPWLAILLGLATLGGLGYLGKIAYEAPLTDVATNPAHPEQFEGSSYVTAYSTVPPDVSFEVKKTPGPVRLPALQQSRYPDIKTIYPSLPVSETFALVDRVARQMPANWRVILSSPETHRVEMEVTSPILHLVDDVAVVVRPFTEDGSRSFVEMRSRSRHWGTDFGSNAANLRELAKRIEGQAALKEQKQ